MIIVNIIGGLGNQMFQYAFYRNLKNKGFDVKLNLNEIKDYKLHNGYELDNIFDLEYDCVSEKTAVLYSDIKRDVFSRIRRKIFGKKESYIKENERESKFDTQGLDKNKNYYLKGYWYSFLNFEDSADLVKKDFCFSKLELNEQNKSILNEINKTNSVAIHIRRGDYIQDKKTYEILGRICDIEYYQKCISIMTEKIQDCSFFVFSNDIEWCKSNIKFPSKANYIDWNKKENSYIDMYLMSQCKHNIIPNSSFSWWGAFLNNNPQKVIIAPKNWTAIDESNGKRHPQNWICI